MNKNILLIHHNISKISHSYVVPLVLMKYDPIAIECKERLSSILN